MKNYRMLVPIVLILLMIASWNTLISDAKKEKDEYEKYLSEARRYAEIKLTKPAMQYYLAALELNETVEIYKEVADYYEEESKETASMRSRISWGEKFIEAFPKAKEGYEILLEIYYEDENYQSCFEIISVANRRHIESEYILKIYDEIAYTYKLAYGSYDDVRSFSNQGAPVKKDEYWGMVNQQGGNILSCQYQLVSSRNSRGYTAVVNQKDEPYFVDFEGAKILVAKEEYKKFGMLSEGRICAQKKNGAYIYLDEESNELFGDYEYASTFNQGVAVIKDKEGWKIINDKGEVISKRIYDNIVIDEREIAFRNECLFVQIDNTYSMIDIQGNQRGNLQFEDAKLFEGQTYACVMINGEWCFIDNKGVLKSDKTYEDARPFSNGLAGVKIDGKWGFVDLEEELKIPNIFMDAKEFNGKGSCFVNIDGKWKMLKLYRFN